jgi:transcriptional regulator with XRE-family HTH domain
VSDRLVMVREKLGLTQREMAQRLGLALGTYGRSEAGTRAIDDGEIAVIGSMGIDLNWLILARGDIDASSSVPFGVSKRETPSRSPTDPALLALLMDGTAAIYRQYHRKLDVELQAVLVAKLYDRLIVIADEAERRGAIRYALDQLAEDPLGA